VPFEYSPIARLVIGYAIEVHRQFGPGLLESPYDECLARVMTREGMRFERQVVLPIDFQGFRVPRAYRVDFIVADALIVEVKSVQRLVKLHEDQVLTYLKLTGLRHGLLINFNVRLLKDGVRSLINPRVPPGTLRLRQGR